MFQESGSKISNKTLDRIEPGSEVTIQSVNSSESILYRKLLTMGFISGSKIKVLRRAPFGDPITVKALGSTLALRLSEARSVVVS